MTLGPPLFVKGNDTPGRDRMLRRLPVSANKKRDRHLETSQVLDFLEERLGEAGTRAVERHLGRPCTACRERVRALGELIAIMHQDRVGPVPPALRQRALGVFAPVERPSLGRGLVDAVAELLFDSSGQHLTTAARRSVGEARRILFGLGAHSVELEIEREGGSTISMRGGFAATDAHLWTIVVEVGEEQRVVRPDVDGSFVLNGLPLARLNMYFFGLEERFRLPTIEP
jgi:hypothetical protein